ncbi:16S rRNA (guanine(966)-N(2))-methyltransferase RsmD [Jeotgalibacillus proteolyticus]|uniref:16S rRNA (Guanine(966)-N(2))-methyltransferase RsmD n=1 Tax=Jeotgalibacillus proteolyticus TaxID=2082395 RepID=A0A2S5GGP7_9BACL|nr:16S rRNA (guanine(966)-N(2))-methyltransferase RsmD [Jeotgalibacillus proteolyticus]PPA72159.1 16S rRNA (guanine(966)-N(2))-methyltransferase RsmD [Jeotgalibacillus proteolyticus]
MRIISGEKKGIHLKAVPGMNTRPTTDKVKEAIFNMIGPYFDGGRGLDLFAGSGSLGLEAMSRGLEHVIFVDRDRQAIGTIKDNIERCGYSDYSEVFRNDAERALKAITKRGLEFTTIFLDPPYKKQKLIELIEKIDQDKLLAAGGVIMCEHSSDTRLPEKAGSFSCLKSEAYGGTLITIYTHAAAEEE